MESGSEDGSCENPSTNFSNCKLLSYVCEKLVINVKIQFYNYFAWLLIYQTQVLYGGEKGSYDWSIVLVSVYNNV